MGLLIESIKNELYQRGTQGVFPRASYKEGLVSYEESDPASPTSIIVRERTSTYDLPRTNRQTGRRDRTAWTLDLILTFNQEVTSEPFEDVMATNIIVAATTTENQITLELESVSYEHPPHAGGGSRITFSFLATIGAI